MRWKKEPYKPRLGDEYIVTEFLFLPKTIRGETRWLETATYVRRANHYSFCTNKWEDWKWVD